MHIIRYLDIDENEVYNKIIMKVLDKSFEIEKIPKDKISVSIILTNSGDKSRITLVFVS